MDREIHQEIEELQRRLDALRLRVAVERPAEQLPPGPLHVLRCEVAGEQAALPVFLLEEVLPMAMLASVPEAPSWVAGFLNRRGELLPVLDVSARVAGAERRYETSDFIVVCRTGGRKVGLIVQEVMDVRVVDRGELQPPPADLPHAGYLLALFADEGRPRMVIGLQRLIETSSLPDVSP
jgi:chemotaxis-related protein WspB